jgi:sodium-dependent dicarboxylate transporter 2/3/5
MSQQERAGPSGDPPESPVTSLDSAYGLHQWIGLMAGLVLFFILLLAPVPAGLTLPAWRTAAVGVLMAVWWMTEAIPISVTALLPLVLFPVLGISGIGEAAGPFANPLIFLYLGGFIIAVAMERWNLHRRIALNLIRLIGVRPRSIIASFMISTAFLSMWVSNTATALMMLPIGLSVVQLAGGKKGATGGEASNFAVALMLAIAYAASIGGMATIIGTPTTAVLVGFMSETYGFEISFAQWMMVGLPLALIGLPITHVVLTRVTYPVRLKELIGGKALIDAELRKLGRITRPEQMVAVIFTGVALLWITRPFMAAYIPGLSDTGIAMFGAVLLFLIPVDWRRGLFLLDWQSAERIPWGVLLLFGGGLSLAAAISSTGLATWIGNSLSGISTWPIVLTILLVVILIILLTELTSNTATAAAFLPVVASVAIGIGQNPLMLAVPAVLAASCAFMLPVATPPNAVVYGSGFLTIPQMVRAGSVLNILFVLLLTAFAYTLVTLVFDVQLGVVPAWAQ